ncbi:glycoside hydrolase family 32 protein [Microbacterium sp. 3J1]|uniref:glycoside hydrolase family 32 protein n=1 Tax=Microbacterium sp. 3J1 TaxID=861269 RepID=UPI00159EC3A8|nr:glycoside hydrolase family 32 protein [Microbacterium sp. 3J1]
MAAVDIRTDARRPRAHYAPRHNWMNDPNGLIHHGGRYHLYYQYNPHGIDHGNMSWGHASSADLHDWTEHDVAILFDEHEQIFSGSVVFDEANTSGLGTAEAPPLVAIYTSARSDGIQAQSLAFSTDGGDTWVRHSGNPVLDRTSTEFRDPKVFRYCGDGAEYWVMVAVEATERRVLLYRSDDLRSWSYLSDYGPAGAVGGVWECPDLFPLAMDGDPSSIRWVMIVSINPGGLRGGSGTQYIVGDFDGVRFTPDTPLPLVGADDRTGLAALDWLDLGADCYAGVTYNGLPDDRRTLIAWMSNWDYAGDVDATTWRGAMTTARRLTLRHDGERARLVSEAILPAGTVDVRAGIAPQETLRHTLPEAARLSLTSDEPDAAIRIVVGDVDRCVVIDVDAAAGTLRFDRTLAAPARSTVVIDAQTAQLGPRTAERPEGLDLAIVVDNGSVELFAAGGTVAMTNLVSLAPAPAVTITATAAVRLTIEDLDG